MPSHFEYQSYSFFGSGDLKKTPPTPRTFAMWSLLADVLNNSHNTLTRANRILPQALFPDNLCAYSSSTHLHNFPFWCIVKTKIALSCIRPALTGFYLFFLRCQPSWSLPPLWFLPHFVKLPMLLFER